MYTRAIALCSIISLALAACTSSNPPAPATQPAVAAAEEQIVVAPPVIPPTTINLTDFGGNGDGKTFNTQAFKKAIAALKAQGGGRLEHPARRLSDPPLHPDQPHGFAS